VKTKENQTRAKVLKSVEIPPNLLNLVNKQISMENCGDYGNINAG
jgi:hypothetical protein